MTVRDNHSSAKILAGIVATFVVLMGITGITLATQSQEAFQFSFSRPGARTQPAPIAHISYKGEDGKNALELLKSHVHVSTRQSSYGEYVDTIDGRQSGEDGKYWALYVNGKSSPIAAGNYVTRDGDALEWKLE
jgi:hypothetical protein